MFPPLRREFHRVAQQVVQDLLEAHAVGVNRRGNRNAVIDVDGFGRRTGPDGGNRLVHALPDIEDLALDAQASRFDLAEIQNVVDQLQQMQRIFMDVIDEALLLFVQRPFESPRPAAPRIR